MSKFIPSSLKGLGKGALENMKSAASNVGCALGADGKYEIGGYKFSEEELPNIMAYLFGDELGAERCEEILEKAENIENPQEREEFIEKEVRKYAAEKDEAIGNGLKECFTKDAFSNASKLYKDEIAAGNIEQGESMPMKQHDPMMLSVMQGLGLNVDPNSMETSYSETPPKGNPKTFTVTFQNRPTLNLADEKSAPNRLSELYQSSLKSQGKDQEVEDFSKTWEGHRSFAEDLSKEQNQEESKENPDIDIPAEIYEGLSGIEFEEVGDSEVTSNNNITPENTSDRSR